jgi:hypothetical protein
MQELTDHLYSWASLLERTRASGTVALVEAGALGGLSACR